MGDILIGYNFMATPETGDKVTRAEPFAALVGAERVHMVKGDWNSVYRDELRNFPGGVLKDQVDASSRAFAELVGLPQGAQNAAPEEMDEADEKTPEPAGGSEDPWGA